MTEQPDLGGLQPQVVEKKKLICSICNQPCKKDDLALGSWCADFENAGNPIPFCRHCGEPLTEVTEFRDDHEDFEWNPETQRFEGQGWDCNEATLTCAKCSNEVPSEERSLIYDNCRTNESLLTLKLEGYEDLMQRAFGTTDLIIITQTLESLHSFFQQVRGETAKRIATTSEEKPNADATTVQNVHTPTPNTVQERQESAETHQEHDS